MDLEHISQEYQQGLIKFFNNKKVIDFIYEEQYGKDYYNRNKESCIKQYEQIMKNTLFVPYITMEDLGDFLARTREERGDYFLDKFFSEEINLYRKLKSKKSSIIQEYTKRAIESITEIIPDFEIAECELSKDDYKENVNTIKDYINLYREDVSDSVIKKAYKLIDTYVESVKGKILIETSSYYKHRRDLPDEKYCAHLYENMLEKECSVQQSIGKNGDKNFRYIYIPVMSYLSKEDFLTVALHEVMHISKEKIYGDKYQSGLFIRTVSPNEMKGSLNAEYDVLESIVQSARWLSLELQRGIDVQGKIYTKSHKRDMELEEAFHHMQVRRVANKIIKNGMEDLLKLPYRYNFTGRSQIVYENTDEVTKKFMAFFGEDIQRINRGSLSIEAFKNKIGYNNYALLGSLYVSWNYQGENTSESENYTSQSNVVFAEDSKNTQEYIKIGSKIIENMRKNAERYTEGSKMPITKKVTGMER